MTDKSQPQGPDSPAPVEPDVADAQGAEAADAGKTVVRQAPSLDPDPATKVSKPPQATVPHGTVPAAPPPDATPVAEPRPPAPPETYAKPSAPAPTEWPKPAAPEGADEPGGPATGDGEPDWAGAAPSTFTDRPELAIGGAFAGGLLIAMILKRLAR